MLTGLSVTTATGRVQRFDFRFSNGALRDDEIMDSAMSAPGRYLLEIGRRILAASPQADHVILGNPLLPLRAATLAAWVGEAVLTPAVATDAEGFPIAYILPRRMFEGDGRFLLLLSLLDAQLDAQLIAAVSQAETSCFALPVAGLGGYPRKAANGWMNGDDRLRSLIRQCRMAVAIMETNPAWRSLPFAAYHPYHAGDVLLFATASRLAEPQLFAKQIVCQSFRDIPAAAGSALETAVLRLPFMARDGSVGKYLYFKHALQRLGDDFCRDNFIVFSRFMRQPFANPFHFVDQARFAQGDAMDSFARTAHARPTAAARRCDLPTAPLKVLLHLDGGWSLKTYPADNTRVLLTGLRGLGFEVSVLDRPDLAAFGATPLVSGDVATLRAQVEAHHIFVGMDSFPQNFVNNVLGWPVVGLFGNTRQSNADAFYGDGRYRSESNQLPCNRCGGTDVCPLFQRADCINFVTAEKVLADVADLARRIYGVTP